MRFLDLVRRLEGTRVECPLEPLGAYAQAAISRPLAPHVARLFEMDAVVAYSVVTIAVLLLFTAVQLVIGELAPKAIALRFPTETALATVLPIAIGGFALAMVLNTWRLLRGPGLPDRLLALDTLYVDGLALLALLGIQRATDVYFEAGSTGYGLLNAAHGCGALAGTLTLATLGHHIRRPGTSLLVIATGLGCLLTVFSRAPALWVALPILALVGMSNSVYLTQVNTLLQQKVPDQLRGRVMSLYALCWNLLPLGGLVAGALAAAVDARFAVLIGGVMVAANALLLLTSRRLRALA